MNETADNVLMFWDVTVSYLVSANSKEQAIELANFRINERTIRLDRITLVNEQGVQGVFKVERVEFVQWTKADSTEYSSLFNVFGHIRLALVVKMEAGAGEALHYTTFKLPRSAIHDKAIFVIPAMNDHAFTQVMSQSIKWNSAVKETPAIARVVYL